MIDTAHASAPYAPLVIALTEFSKRSYERALRRAYGNRGPDSQKRWLDVESHRAAWSSAHGGQQPSEPPAPGPRVCSVEDCDRTARARGWCKRHYARWWRTGDPLPPPPVQIRTEVGER